MGSLSVIRRGGGLRLAAGLLLLAALAQADLTQAQSGRGRGRAATDPDSEAVGAGVDAGPGELIRKAQELMQKSAYAEAEPYARQALSMAQNRGAKRPMGVAAGILGTAMFHMGHPAEAEAMLRLSIPLREAEFGTSNPGTLALMGMLGIAQSQQGKFAEAQSVLNDMLKREQAVGKPGDPPITRAHLHYGSVLMFTSKRSEAEAHFRAAIDNAAQGSAPANQYLLQRVLYQYAKLLVQSTRSPEAVPIAHQSVELGEKLYGQESIETARAQIALAQALYFTGSTQEAAAVAAVAAPKSEKLLGRNNPETATANLLLGLLAERKGSYTEADAAMKQALEVLRQNGAPTKLVLSTAHYARFLQRRDRDAEALEQFKYALDVVDKMYAGTRGLDEESRLAFANNYVPLYYEAVALLVKMHRASPRSGYDREALSVVSRTQSRLFAEMLREADVKRFSADPGFQKLQQQRESLLAELAKAHSSRAARVRLDDTEDGRSNLGFFAKRRADSIAADSARQISELEASLKAVEEQLTKQFPRYMELVQPRPVDVASLQKLLHPGEAVLSFFVAPRQTAAFLVTPNQFAMRPVNLDRKQIADLVWKARHTSEATAGTMATLSELDPAILNQLYTALIQPIETLLQPGQKVIVVADGPLFTLPLEMLVTRYGPEERERFAAERARARTPLSEYGTLPYLGDRYRFSYLPSLSALVSQRLYSKPSVRFDRELASFADPMFSRENLESSVPEATRSMLKNIASRGTSLLPRLPETADEAQGIARSLGGKADLFLRANAQEHTVKTSDFRTTRFLHFATHGLLGGEFLQVKRSLEDDNGDAAAPAQEGSQRNLQVVAAAMIDDEPAVTTDSQSARKAAQPALALTLVGETAGEDGLLTMSEVIESLDLNADVVVLSACNTAGESAEASSGEGFAGLTRAFMYAGAHALIVSHWSVDSISTTTLITSAFGELKSGRPLDQALADARAKVRASSGEGYSRAHPFFWAPFVQIGD